jgi:amino acid transporter
MVAGGPYGLEDILGGAGYVRGLLLLAFIPLIWSLPVALMVGELASALPDEGGYYVWVRRALGPFWGFQEAWLSMAASVFDMAIYPVIFVTYLGRFAPSWTAGHRALGWELAVVLGCTLWNLRGAKAVGDSSVVLMVILLAPFAAMIGFALWRWHGHGTGALLQPVTSRDLATAASVTVWNYMGWDNASTVAQEVENPQRNYPRAMLAAAALVALTYILPLLAVGLAGMSPEAFTTGAWTDAARSLAGPVLAGAVVLGGMINGAGMFNPLMMSYTRVPFAVARDAAHDAISAGRSPNPITRLLTRETANGVPWVSVLFCAGIWALALNFSFERLISIDLVLYGTALLLEFVALAVLRWKEPALKRPFHVPGGNIGAVAIGFGPACVLLFSLWAARGEHVAGMPALLFAALIGAVGAIVYLLGSVFAKRTTRNTLA